MDDVATSLVPRKRKRAGGEGEGGGDRPIAAKGERVMKFEIAQKKSQDEKAPPGRKMNEASKREEAVAHSTEARKREEAK